jgi:hypothetical protein
MAMAVTAGTALMTLPADGDDQDELRLSLHPPSNLQ